MIALLNIGTELLKGRTVNTNASFMGDLLKSEGYLLNKTSVIHDEKEIIRQEAEDLLASHDVVLVTGGLGPTKDDITKTTLMEMFGGELVLHQSTLDQIERIYVLRNKKVNSANVLQAHVPSSCEVIPNEMGTAPCMLFRREGKILVSMPGVPFEMKHLMRTQIVPLLKREFNPGYIRSAIIRTHGISESALSLKVDQKEQELPDSISVAYLPSLDGTKIEMTVRGAVEDAKHLDQSLATYHKDWAAFLDKYSYSTEDLTPDAALTAFLRENNLSFATAESCTGGGIAAKLVRHSGVSSVFKGGIVAYQEEIKTKLLGVPAEMIKKEGVVSEAVAIAMASGAREALGSDAAVSITGYAEVGEDSEVGPHAWIGFADEKEAFARRYPFFKNRKINLEFGAYAALVLALRTLRDGKKPEGGLA